MNSAVEESYLLALALASATIRCSSFLLSL